MFRMVGFVRFPNIVHCSSLSDNDDSFVGLVRKLYNKSVSHVNVVSLDSVELMLERVFVDGLSLSVVDSHVDSRGETVFVVMGKVHNVYKMLAYFAFLHDSVCDVGLVLDSQKVNSVFSHGGTVKYSLSFPDLSMNGDVSYSLKFPHAVTDMSESAIFQSAVNASQSVVKVREFFSEVPDYVKILAGLNPPPYCAGMFSDVKKIVSTVNV